MKDISSIEKSKDVIKGLEINRESVYYTALFGAASVVSLVLLIISYVQRNAGLKIYSWILLPIFLIGTLAAARYAFVSKNRIYTKCGVLVIKSFFITRHFEIAKIEKLTAAKFGDKGLASVNITYGEKSFKYTFKDCSKEEINELRRLTSRH